MIFEGLAVRVTSWKLQVLSEDLMYRAKGYRESGKGPLRPKCNTTHRLNLIA